MRLMVAVHLVLLKKDDEQLEKTKHYLYRWKKSTAKAHKKFLEEKERKNGGQQAVE